MLDVAELDDISGVAFMAMLFAVMPILEAKSGGLGARLFAASAAFVIKFSLFAALCFVIARYVERPWTRIVSQFERPPQRMITVAGVGSASRLPLARCLLV
jgi:Kef-type K+ transport system membrane component KefB